MSTLTVVPDEQRPLAEKVAEEVRAMMARVRMTQTDLAEVLGLQQSGVSKRLRGVIPFRVDELDKLAEALGVHPAVFLGAVPAGRGGPDGGDGPSLPIVVTRR